ncbi:AmpG family muropeptide MFS transporter [Oleiagrimonas soli]|uniref:PAT family beta-lactamase induction signal transducer AmpG n=1 Tax=Oleiagrimonas soli TaxID=1543381 RepID=A0A099D045_9GAMM|nr:MFS transporter [Oleiagrimonas soli]KGI79217.1 signal transduction protein [Oleiagrimonas soli]MBB6184897.1 PAT family beta-lactamase induction signal transducer AmpG [Oleiagrimonas soli]
MTAAKPRGWRGIMQAFATPSAGTLCLLGFGSGLPFLLIGYTVSIWLREYGLTLGAIGLFSYVSFFYVFKFLWAPLLDRWKAPILGFLGRRRGWLALSQIVLIAALVGMASTGPAQLDLFVGMAMLAGFSGATQDTMIDAYRIEIAPQEAQAALAATYTLGYRFGLILSGAGALYIAAYSSWHVAYLLMAASLLAPLLTTLAMREPDAIRVRERVSFQASFVEPFRDFFRRHGAIVAIALLLFVGLFKLPDQMLGVINGPFYIDTGYTKDQIATVSKVYGVWIGIAGAFLGGVSVAGLGLKRSLYIAALGVALSNLLYLLMAQHPGQTWAFIAAISGDNSTLGFAGVVLVAFLSSLTSMEFTATQYALLSSLANLPGKLIGGFSGFLVERWTYSGFYIFSALSVLPTLLLLAWLSRRMSLDRSAGADDEAAKASQN